MADNFEAASSAIRLTAGDLPINMVVADMNGDGLPDLVTGDEYNDSVYVDYNQGNGGFRQVAQNIRAGQLGYVAAGDFDLDGGPDLMAIEPLTNSAAVLLDRGTNQAQLSGVILPGTRTHLIEATTQAGGVYAASTSNKLSLAAGPRPAEIQMFVSPSTGVLVNHLINARIAVPTVSGIAPTGTASLYQGS